MIEENPFLSAAIVVDILKGMSINSVMATYDIKLHRVEQALREHNVVKASNALSGYRIVVKRKQKEKPPKIEYIKERKPKLPKPKKAKGKRNWIYLSKQNRFISLPRKKTVIMPREQLLARIEKIPEPFRSRLLSQLRKSSDSPNKQS